MTEEIEVPPGSTSFFLNLTTLMGHDARITDGSHDRDNVIRTATMSQKDKIMTMTLFGGNVSRGRAEVSVEWEEDGVKRNMTFGVIVGGEAPTTVSDTMTTTSDATLPQTGSSATVVATSQPVQRDLLWSTRRTSEEEDEEEAREEEKPNVEDESLPLHPMGLGERVGTQKYPWQQVELSSRKLLDV